MKSLCRVSDDSHDFAAEWPEIPEVIIQLLIALLAFGASRSMRLLVSVSRVYCTRCTSQDVSKSWELLRQYAVCGLIGLRWYLSPKGSEGDLAKTWQLEASGCCGFELDT